MKPIKDYTLILLLALFAVAAICSCKNNRPSNYKTIDLPEEIGEVSSDSTNPTLLTAFKRNDTVFIQFKNY